MITIISATNRPNAVSYDIANQYSELLAEHNVESTILSLEKMPVDFIESALYDNAGKNDEFNQMREIMNNADKLVFIIPEYNGSFPGVLKVLVDGLDRSKAFGEKKCALLGISAGDQGGILAMSHFSDILNYCGAHVLGYRLRIPGIKKLMTDNRITSPEYLARLRKHVKQFISF